MALNFYTIYVYIRKVIGHSHVIYGETIPKWVLLKLKLVRVKLQLHDAIYRLRFYSDSLIYIFQIRTIT